jgi:PTH1 family peptidyl-tRNA hydrolase
VTWLVVGLGNPGPRYELTRHNVGQLVIDELAERLNTSLSQHRTNTRVGQAWLRPGGPKLILAKSNGYMNTSGAPVSSLAKYFSVDSEHLIVIHDDLDLPLGAIRLKRGGGHGGHNGLRDIAKAIDTPNFLRVRVGIGRPPGRQDAAEYVLRPFAKRDPLEILLADAADAVELVVDEGLASAQNRVHSKPVPPVE